MKTAVRTSAISSRRAGDGEAAARCSCGPWSCEWWCPTLPLYHAPRRLAPIATRAAIAAIAPATAPSGTVATRAALGRTRFAGLEDAFARAVALVPLGEREELA